MFTDLPNLICKACATVNTNIFLFGLITDSVTHAVECVPKNFARVCKDINTSRPYVASP